MAPLNKNVLNVQIRFSHKVLDVVEKVSLPALIKVRNHNFLIAHNLPGSEKIPDEAYFHARETYSASQTSLNFIQKGSVKTDPYPG